MVTRRQSREWALQALVQFDLNPPVSIDADLADFWEHMREIEADELAEGTRGVKLALNSTDEETIASLEEARAFAEEHIRGVWKSREQIDAKIEPYLRNWSLYRLGTVERAVLRLGAWVLLNLPNVPSPVIVNECVDLAKFFSETKSGRFVNGVLDSMAKKERV